MRVLRYGSKGKDVESWEYFLRGQQSYMVEVDQFFGKDTVEATKDFQSKCKLIPDGIVGKRTYAQAMLRGFSPLKDDSDDKHGPNWPPPPAFKPLVGNAARARVFGKFNYKPAGNASNPEAIKILDNWAHDNIVRIEIPQVVGLRGTYGAKSFHFHKLAAPQVQAFFRAVECAGHSGLLETWGGSYAPRFIRGSRSVLSNHSFASAFDINVPWNYLGAEPALVGRKGSVRLLVPIAHEFGLYWGGHFRRKDGMHFEVAEVLKESKINKTLKKYDKR